MLEAIRAGSTRKAAALHAGIHEVTLITWANRFANFANDIARAEADAQLRMEAIVMQAAITDWHAASWWLERRRPDDYGLRQNPETLAAAGVQVTIAFDRANTNDETTTLSLPDASDT